MTISSIETMIDASIIDPHTFYLMISLEKSWTSISLSTAVSEASGTSTTDTASSTTDNLSSRVTTTLAAPTSKATEVSRGSTSSLIGAKLVLALLYLLQFYLS